MELLAFLKDYDDIISGKSKSEMDVQSCEKKLGVTFSEDYRQCIMKYGFIMVNGHEIAGISSESNLNVVELTQIEREKKKNLKIPADWYVIENLQIDDVYIWQSSTGEIFQTTPTEMRKLGDSLKEYIAR